MFCVAVILAVLAVQTECGPELISHRKRKEVKQNEFVCTNNDCNDLVEEYQENINKGVNPCDNFYEFVCGNWLARHPRPPNSILWSSGVVLRDKLLEESAALLGQNNPNDVVGVQIARKYFQSCMDIGTREANGIDPLNSILQRNGGWPIVLEELEWSPETYPWENIERSYGKLANIFALFALQCATSKLTGNCILQFSRPFLPFTDRTTNYNRKLLYKNNRYSALIKNVAKEFASFSRSTISPESIKKDVENIINFEQLINSAPTSNISEMTMVEFQNLYNLQINDSLTAKFNWMENFICLFKDVNIVNKDTEIISVDVAYFTHLAKILQETPIRTIVNYIHWNFLSYMLKASNAKMRNLVRQATVKIPQVSETLEPSIKNCIRGYHVKKVLGYMHAMNYYTDEVQKESKAMMRNLIKAFKNKINALNWLDDSSRGFVIRKIDTLQLYVGLEDALYDRTRVDDWLKLKWVVGINWIENTINERKFHLREILQSINTEKCTCFFYEMPINSLIDKMEAQYQSENILTVFSGFFRTPYFLSNVTTVNYGAVGTIIGHELAHSIDFANHDYKVWERVPWPEQTEEEYGSRISCILEQYNDYYGITKENYTASSLKLEENFADTVGLEIAFSAFQRLKKISSLPEFTDYTANQQFFIAFANTQCAVSDPVLDLIDSHSTGEYRVIQTLRNSDAFAKEFNCPKGSPMNPKKKCNFWK